MLGIELGLSDIRFHSKWSGDRRPPKDHGALRSLTRGNWKMRKILQVLILTLFCIWMTAESNELSDVSMIQLIANPQQYEGKPIRVIAFLNLEFEGNALYLHREDFDRSILSNAVWISLDKEQVCTSRKLSGGYVLVEGIFSAKDRGHFGMFSGSIQHVTRIQGWRHGKR